MEKLMYPNERKNCLRANEQYTATTWLQFGREHTWFQVNESYDGNPDQTVIYSFSDYDGTKLTGDFKATGIPESNFVVAYNDGPRDKVIVSGETVDGSLGIWALSQEPGKPSSAKNIYTGGIITNYSTTDGKIFLVETTGKEGAFPAKVTTIFDFADPKRLTNSFDIIFNSGDLFLAEANVRIFVKSFKDENSDSLRVFAGLVNIATGEIASIGYDINNECTIQFPQLKDSFIDEKSLAQIALSGEVKRRIALSDYKFGIERSDKFASLLDYAFNRSDMGKYATEIYFDLLAANKKEEKEPTRTIGTDPKVGEGQ